MRFKVFLLRLSLINTDSGFVQQKLQMSSELLLPPQTTIQTRMPYHLTTRSPPNLQTISLLYGTSQRYHLSCPQVLGNPTHLPRMDGVYLPQPPSHRHDNKENMPVFLKNPL
jgi:hypothetical protein